MPRRKAAATQRITFPSSLTRPAPPPPPPRARRWETPIYPPVYKHASPSPNCYFRGPVAALFQLPIPPSLPSTPLPETCPPSDTDHFYRSYIDAFNHAQRPTFTTGSACQGSVAVLVRHWDAGTEISAAGIRRANPTRIANFLNRYDIPVNNHLLTIAVTPQMGPCRTFDFDMQGASLPAVVLKMVAIGMLRLLYVPDADAVQFVLALRDPLDCSAKLCALLRSKFCAWLCNYKLAAGLTVDERARYDKPWVFDVVRRLPTDADVDEYLPFLERVRANRDLNVTLRSYQERAVAWMLSRELGHRLQVSTDVLWKDAEELSKICPLKDSKLGVTVEPHVKIDIVTGIIQTVTRGQDGFTNPNRDGARRLSDIEARGMPAGEPALDSMSDESPTEEEIGRGGLLCDEMGLGKTVELMQLVLCNKFDGAPATDQKREGGEENANQNGHCLACDQEVSLRANARYRSCLECERRIHDHCLGCQREQADKEGFVCLSCREAVGRLFKPDTPVSSLPMSKATVVVIPTSLLLQWKKEIEKHVKDALKIEIYQGHNHSGYVAQRRLVEADVVLATYDALKSDVNTFHALRNPRRGLRHVKVFRPTPLPLLTVRWHRLAWDESQMLGSGGVTRAATLANYMHATYRWCVTGTPMICSLQDALPMFDILRIRGSQELMHWSSFFSPSIFAEDEKRLKLALRRVMWRSSKEDVSGDELQLPPQVTEVVHVPFGPVERYHYSSLQQSVRTATLRFSTVQDYRSRTISSDLLTMLRQACCHPQIGISGRRLMSRAALQALASLGPSRALGSQSTRREDAASQAVKRAESPLDMNEVLHALVAKANADCAEALRSYIAAGNGLAAVCWLQHSLLPSKSTNVEGLVTAVKLYRETLGLAEENKNVVRMDSIQRMHILFNLNEALSSVALTKTCILELPGLHLDKKTALLQLGSLGRTMRDANLMQEVDTLKQSYLAEAKAQLVASEASYRELAEELDRDPLLAVAQKSDGDEDEDGPDWDDVLEEDLLFGGVSKNGDKDELQWWHRAAAVLLEKEEKKQYQFVNRVVQKLLDAIPGGGMNVRTLAHRLTSIHSFSLVLRPELMKLQQARNKLREVIVKMPGSVEPTQSQVAESGQCRECREFGTGPACAHCRTEKLFRDVERQLYALRETDESADFVLDNSKSPSEEMPSSSYEPTDPKMMINNALRPKGRVSDSLAQNSGGLRFQSEAETILKSLASAAREAGDVRLNQEVSEWFERFESVKKEHTEARILFEAQRSLLARMDEVNMALMRFSVLAPEEDLSSLSEMEQRHRLPAESLASLNVQFTGEKAVAEADFRNKRGNLVFLRSLQNGDKQVSGQDGAPAGHGPRTEVCPVCLSEFDDAVTKVALFICGHVICCDCTLLMIKRSDVRSRVSSVRCPTCRVKCPVEEINFTMNGSTKAGPSSVQRSKDQNPEADEDEEIQPDGHANAVGRKRKRSTSNDSRRKKRRVVEHKSTFYDFSAAVIGLIGAKASAVVRTLRGIWQQHNCAKVLIFSEWAEVLGLVSRALAMNNISHNNGSNAASAMKFARMVDTFRFTESQKVLLLPLKRAGAGLNLIEATHVMLIEPSMNVSLEAQGVGRVHRIGQEEQTYVHRIIMKDTIEETVLRLGDIYRGKTGLVVEDSVNLREVMGAIHSEVNGDQEAIVVSDSGEDA